MKVSKVVVKCKLCKKKHFATLYTKNGNIVTKNYKPPNSVYKSETSSFLHGINRGWYCKECIPLFERDELVRLAYFKLTNKTLH